MLVLAVALLVFAVLCFAVVAWLYPDDAVPECGADVFAAAFKKKQSAMNGGSDGAPPTSATTNGDEDGPLLTYLKSKCCAIPVYPQRDGTTFSILKSPSEFFQHLKSMIMAADTKISISALYVGDGELSREFVKCLESRVESKVVEIQRTLSSEDDVIIKPLQIEIVLDYNRMHHRANLRTLKRLLELGSELHVLHERLAREKPHLVGRSGGAGGKAYAATVTSVRLHLFQTPSQLNRFYPPKFFGRAREILGVQHTKLFSFDRKDVIATGANLSDDYFISRMDRYAVVRDCKGLGTWYDEAIHTLTLMSYEVTAETSTSSPSTTTENDDGENIKKEADGAAVTPKMTPKSVVCASPTSALPTPAPFSLSGPSPPSPPTTTATQPKKSTHKMTELIIRHCPMGFDATDQTDAFIAASKVVWASFIDRVANMPECGMVGASSSSSESEPPLTWIFPTLQFGRSGLYHDSIIVEEMVKGLASLDVRHHHHHAAAAATNDDNKKSADNAAAKGNSDDGGSNVPTAAFYFTSPYMNCYPELVRCMQQTTYTPTTTTAKTTTTTTTTPATKTTSIFNFITASINTNGWKGQRGFAGLIPSFYLQLLRNFHYLMKQLGLSDRVGVFEYSKAGMTFHSKGLWICSSTTTATPTSQDAGVDVAKEVIVNERKGGEMPFLAAYGSTNYGHRSVHKDVESEILIYTRDPSLRNDMGEELQRLLTHSTPVVEKTLFLGAKAPGRFRPVVAAVAHMGHRFL